MGRALATGVGGRVSSVLLEESHPLALYRPCMPRRGGQEDQRASLLKNRAPRSGGARNACARCCRVDADEIARLSGVDIAGINHELGLLRVEHHIFVLLRESRPSNHLTRRVPHRALLKSGARSRLGLEWATTP